VGSPLLELYDTRLDVGGHPVVDGLAFASHGERLLVLGGSRALFEAASGMVAPVRGSVNVRSVPAVRALRAARVAGAPLDPALPPQWTPRVYATWSARIAGRDEGTARDLADDAVKRLGMTAIADTPLGKTRGASAPPEVSRRAMVIAAALATGAPS